MSPKSSRLDASDKVVLMMSLVSYLQANPSVSVGELAENFDVSSDVIRAAISLLAVSGVPGATATYQANDLFDIDWDLFLEHDEVTLTHSIALDDAPRLSAREAASLVAGLTYISQFVSAEELETLGAVKNKLALGSVDSGVPQLGMVLVPTPAHSSLIQGAIRDRKQITFDYVNAQNESSHRIVDPIRIDAQGQLFYLRGWCHTLDQLRTFRLDRMSDVAVSEQSVLSHLDPESLADELYSPHQGALEVHLELDENVLPLIIGYAPTVVSKKDGRVKVTIEFADEAGVIRLVSAYAGAISVVSPQNVKDSVNNWVREQIESLRSESA